MKKISVLVDLTETSYKSVEFAAKIAKIHPVEIVLINIADRDDDDKEVEEKVDSFAKILKDENLPYSISIGKGKFFSTVDMAVAKTGADLVIVGTHGKTGLRQNLFGSNILKLVQSLKVSSLVVQDTSVFPKSGFEKILFPLAENVDFVNKAKHVSEFAKMFNSTICLYSVDKSISGFSTEISHSLKEVNSIFDKEKVKNNYCSEEATEFSVGFARQAIAHAHNNDISLISILSDVAKVNTYFGTVDKENILMNKYAIPVFCANDSE